MNYNTNTPEIRQPTPRKTQQEFRKSNLMKIPFLLLACCIHTQVSATTPPTNQCSIIKASLDSPLVNPISTKPQTIQGRIEIHCKNHNNSAKNIKIKIYQKGATTANFKKAKSKTIQIHLYIDKDLETPFGDSEPLTGLAILPPQSESAIEVPFFGKITLNEIPEAGEYTKELNFEIIQEILNQED